MGEGLAIAHQSQKRRGRTMRITEAWISATATVAGPTEVRGPLGASFDVPLQNDLLGERSWERAEWRMGQRAVGLLAQRLGIAITDFDLMLAGDLTNQITASTFAARELDIPFLGTFTACATFAEALGLAALLCDGGYAHLVCVAVTSHHHAVERQYRFPTELGNQRPPCAQWTATGAAAVAVSAEAGGHPVARIEGFTPGRVIDYRITDPFDMGSAMAPAAADTLAAHLEDMGRQPGEYGAIYTGDLGRVGVPICEELLRDRGIDLSLHDCGIELYDPAHQDVHAGGSGTACSALVFGASVLPRLAQDWSAICLVGTGALHSPTTYQQRESIPAIAHAVSVCRPDRRKEGV